MAKKWQKVANFNQFLTIA